VVIEATPEVQTVTEIAGVEVPKKVRVTKARTKGWSRIGEVIVRDEHLDTLNDAWTLRASGVPAATLITGPAGTAKTALARAFAASLGVPFLKIDGGAIRTADDWAGAFRQDPTTKVWSHRWSPFAQVLRLGQPCVVLVDEVTRTESPQALNAFMGLLDWTGAMLVPDAHEVLRLPAGVLVIATANIGPEFVGTLPLDGAVRQRFPFGIRMAYPDEAIEASLINDLTGLDADVCTRLVTMAVTQRANRLDPQQYPSGAVISTRVLLDIARRITTCNRDPRAAVLSTLSGQFDPEDDAALSVAVDTQFPAAPIVDDESITEMAVEKPWTCPACTRENRPEMQVCWGHDCTYVRLP
jgi:MoxR-like ATPase